MFSFLKILGIFFFLFLSNTYAKDLQPNLKLIKNFSYEDQLKQPPSPYVAEFNYDKYRLYYVAASHSYNKNSPTFSLLNKVFIKFKFKAVIVEGFPNSEGYNSKRLIDYIKRTSNKDIFGGGEIGYTVSMANSRSIDFIGAEPNDSTVTKALLESGFTKRDILGFYFLRQIPQIIQGKILGAKSIEEVYINVLKSHGVALFF